MASQFPGSAPSGGMGARIRNIILSPQSEWPRIDAEPMTARGVFMGWVLPLAAIGPICSLIGAVIFIHANLVGALVGAIIQYAVSLLGVWLLAFIVDALAPSFGGTKNIDQAMKAVAFSYTAAWIAAVLNIIPGLHIVGALLGLYSFYLLWLGLPLLMRVPQDKAVGYVIVSIVVAIVVYIIIGAIIGAIVGAAMLANAGSYNAT